jgi:heat shock protein HslJ/uncharacterized membrane protein/predicted small lipoprotein YifL
MSTRFACMLAVFLVALAGCGKPDEMPPEPVVAKPAAPSAEAAKRSFVNIVWEVKESKQVEPGELRIFLADGTLVMASPHGKPAFGGWRGSNGKLTIVEEGRPYESEILALTDTEFRIRMQSPGEPVEILFVPAEHPVPAQLAAREAQLGDARNRAAEPATQGSGPWGTAWRLVSLPAGRALEGVPATLEFPSEGRITGNGSCNRFNGVVSFDGDAITIGGIAATRKACTEPVMNQEEAYFAALRDSERFSLAGDSLEIYAREQPEPLRFTAMQAAPAGIASAISRAPASTPSSLNGIWTVVGHHAPGVSAESDEKARARNGESIRLTDRVATSSGNSCREPRYATRQVSADAWLASSFQLPAGSLPMLAGRSQMRVMEVSCGNADWTALGATLLEVDRDRALAPWDGVFFELERDRDFRGIGQEPGWQIEIRKGSEMRFTYDYGKASVTTPAPRAQVDETTGRQTFQAMSGANELTVEIVPVACEDSLSGRPFAATVIVTLDERTFRGCGEELATPFEG